ncbi:uncharacterized protein PHACADRAFT_150846 [Phanerochaete carnosa HHB-10118-sp]|uniref:F-box domain-containing protein n=1 Tax=Phanerochaete carnosa (strain HHB-10118-sp) TaxID=650164 RepID=K5VYS1_PHACS|nr:uncharacterized protein PHACADRAFT_150846 [Phanerochaete carnosa HHB-10118-sp]EKM51970.1 hypothetical protein PHACADRAFT_150846 [Phanerochaete carnosa HHB-10118-sp]
MMVTLTDEYPLPQGVVRLPIELCEQVIDYVAGYYDLDQSIKTLLACALTCRFWVPRVRRHLYRFAVVAKTKEQFASLLKRMETQPGFRDIRVLDVGYDRDPIQAHAQTWMSTVPDPLTRGLVHVRCLRLACVPPIVHRSFYVMLAHFRALTGVLLYGCHFERFTDFARLVLSFRTLSQLYLSKVDWPASSKARRGVRACKGMVRMPRLRLEILNMTLSAPYVVADAMNWLLHTSSGSTLHTVSIDFPAVEPQALVPNAAAQLIRACGPTLRSLRLRFDSVKDAAECAHILREWAILPALR